MTESNHGWVWSSLQELVDLTAKQAEVAAEAERLAGRVRDEKVRIQDATGLSPERLGEMVEGMRVIGSPPARVVPLDGEAPAATGGADNKDPLAIPTYLRRGEEASQEGDAKTGSQAEAART